MKYFIRRVIIILVVLIVVFIPPIGNFDYCDKTDAVGFTTRTYYDSYGNYIGESFGYTIDDYITDWDNDGKKEIICNCVYAGDSCRRVYVYKKCGGKYYKGCIEITDENFPGIDNWGNNAVAIHYDPRSRAVVADYSVADALIVTVCLSPGSIEYRPCV